MIATSAHTVMDQVFDSLADCLTPDVARRITEIRLPPSVQSRIDELAAKANEGTLTEQEREQYEEYADAIDFLAIVKAKARLAHRFRPTNK